MDSPYTKNECLECTLKNVHKDVLSESEVDEWNNNRIKLTYKKGENICKQNAHAYSIICVQSGLVKMYKEDNHVSSTLFLKKKGDIIGLQSLYGDCVFHYSAEALSDTQVCLIDMATFKKILSKNSNFSTVIIHRINQDMVGIFDQLYSFSTKHIHGRLAELLLYLRHNVYESNPFQLSLSKTDLSEILGTSKESISRLFKELKHDGIIEESSSHTIMIHDEARLKRISLVG